MKKIFLLIPILAFALMANADVIQISNTSNYILRTTLASANNGDIIEMAGGTYVETGDWLAIDDKAVTVRAAEGEEVIIKPQFSVRVKAGTTNQIGKAEFIGVKFDCSALESHQLFVPSDNQANQSVILKNCELYDWSHNEALIQSTSSRKLDVIDIDNCYFHGFEKSIVFVENANLVSLSITNSTFANVAGNTESYDAAPIDVRAGSGSVLVDHCTFYNVNSKSLSYGTVTVKTIADPVVSNCIFMLTASADMCATNLKAGGDVKNCLTFNYDNWQPYGHYDEATLTDCVKANPLFKDAANGDFSLYASSPARGAGDDASDLGDPRWYKALAPIAIPATLVPFDALLSEKASIIQSTPDSIFLKTESTTVIEWAKWNISVAESGLYDFTAYAQRTNPTGSQRLQIDVLNSTETETLKTKSETGLPTECTISSGAVNLVAGNTYVIKVYNNYDWAKSKLIKVEAAYAGGKTIAIPDTLKPVDAIKSERAFVNEDGELRFTDDDHTGYIHDQWAKWNINVAEVGKYKFTASVNSTNGQNYRITLKNSDESATLGTWYGTGNSSGARKIATEMVDLTAGNYVLMMEDTVKWSHGRVVNIAASYEGGKTVDVPGQILAKEAVIGKVENGHQKMYHLFDNGDLQYDDNGYNLEEFATWTLNVTQVGEMEVTLNVAHSGHIFSLELYQGNTRLDSIGESDATKWDDGDITLSAHLTFPATGTYTLKLINNQQYSGGALHGITFAPYVAPAGVTMTDTDTDNSAWIAEKNNTVNVTVNRTILGGMYNTICLPFKVSSSKCKEIFGNDVELYTLGSASLSGDILNLQFNTASDIWNGTPILIKTSSTIVNPVFEGVTIESETADHTNGGFVTFQGSFVSQTFHAGDQVLLLLANNQLAYPQQDRTLKGFRAYFQINGGTNAAPIRRANIITPNNAPTEISLVNDETANIQKLIEDGQLIIIKNGLRYNAMGVRIK